MYIELANAIRNFPEQLFKFHYNRRKMKSQHDAINGMSVVWKFEMKN